VLRHRTRRRALLAALAFAAARPAPAAPRPTALAVARADVEWHAEFEDICAKTQDAMSLSVEELRRLVERSDRLMPTLERLPDPERKVFTRRLKACRDLYAFVLETKEKEKS
jgi:DNA-directed RNA polymerase specialized sigma24 family protein